MIEDGIPEVARRARLGQTMKGIARTYDRVTPEMRQKILEALEKRWQTGLDGLDPVERVRLESWFPHLAQKSGITDGMMIYASSTHDLEKTEKPSLVRNEKGSLTWTNVLVGDTGIEPVTSTVSTKINNAADLRKRDSCRSHEAVRSRWAQFNALERTYRLPICSHTLLPWRPQ